VILPAEAAFGRPGGPRIRPSVAAASAEITVHRLRHSTISLLGLPPPLTPDALASTSPRRERADIPSSCSAHEGRSLSL